jgi:Rrf2 family nitric oxide-sensitive transcriptional repressor
MQLTFYTDYSMRVLMYLAVNRHRLVNISEIADRFAISRNHLVKVVYNLARGGFIRVTVAKAAASSLRGNRPTQTSAKSSATLKDRPNRWNVSTLRGTVA